MAHQLRLVAMLVLIMLLYFVVPVDGQARGGVALRVLATAVALVALALLVLAQVRLSLAAPERRVDGLVAVIVLVWAVFALVFYVLAVHQPQQVDGLRTRVDALYFVASTMLTIGYGDIHASGQTARVLALVLMGFNVVFVAAAASMLTSRLRRAAADAPPRRRR